MQDENCSSEAKNSKYQLVMSPENKMVDDAEFFLNVKFCLTEEEMRSSPAADIFNQLLIS